MFGFLYYFDNGLGKANRKRGIMSKIVELQDVVKTYGKGEGMQVAVDHVNFIIEEGEFVVILGQSGAGKSTVLNMLGGMDIPTSGKVLIDGKIVSEMNDRQLSEYRAKTIYLFLFCHFWHCPCFQS